MASKILYRAYFKRDDSDVEVSSKDYMKAQDHFDTPEAALKNLADRMRLRHIDVKLGKVRLVKFPEPILEDIDVTEKDLAVFGH